MDIRQTSSRVVYENAWMSVREDEIVRADGSVGIYGVIDKPAYSIIAPYSDGGFHLVEQYRYPVGDRYWEFPQGTFSDRREGRPEDVARIELAEETGLTAGSLHYLGMVYIAYGMSSQACHAFVATDLNVGAVSREPEEQDMRAKWVPMAEFEEMIRFGSIVDAATVTAYALMRLHGRLPM